MENIEKPPQNRRLNIKDIGLDKSQEKCNTELKELVDKAREFLDTQLHIKISEPHYIKFALYHFSQKLISGGLDLSALAKT